MSSPVSIARRGFLTVILLAMLALLLLQPAAAQIARDTTRVLDMLHVRPDSLHARSDTAVVSPSGVDSVVNYTAKDSIVYSLGDKTMHLYGKGKINYKELGLNAERVSINWNTATLHAFGVPDTTDSTGVRGRPDLFDSGEEYHGSEISYNFKSRKGKINLGKTEIEQGLYYGKDIKKVADNVLFVEDGTYTTCDLPHPHYAFTSPKMEVVVGQRVVARPIVLEIADVPVFALPFGVFPTKRGRRSGLIAPAYGESASRGRYLAHLGYYWAINDYLDWNLRGDGYTKGGYLFASDFRYAMRYNFDGSISGAYGKVINGERGDPDYSNNKQYNLQITHNQTFDPTARLVVNFSFMSSSFFTQTSNNLNDILQQSVYSNATFSKYWEGTPNSMTLNISRQQSLRPVGGQVDLQEDLPNISFNRSQSFPFRSKKRSGGESAWYELIGYSYGGQFRNVRTRTASDSTHIGGVDERRGLQHQLNVNASPHFSYFTITPNVAYTELWYDESIRRHYDPTTKQVVDEKVKGFNAIRMYRVGVSTATKLYGIFQPGVFGITGIRHQVTPTISYYYAPDFSKSRYGYYGTYTDSLGRQVRYNRFERGIYGGATMGEQQVIALSVGNVFEMKTAGADSANQENKFQLLNVDAGISYNLAADSLRFSDLSMSFRTNIGQYLSIGGSSTFSLYQFAPDPVNPAFPYAPRTGRRVNKFLIKEEGRLAQLTNFNISISTHLSGERKQTSAGPILTEADSVARATQRGYVGLYDLDAPNFSIPWNLDLSWSFNQSQQNPLVKFRSSSISAALGFNLTEYWKISASTSYDIANKTLAAPQVNVYRDLHCWELDFSWRPTGIAAGYQLEIRLKAPQLHDIKVTKQESARGIY